MSSVRRKLRPIQMELDKEQLKQIACRKCRHYQVTWDPSLPYGCRAHGFKSRRNPSQVVFETSGLQCQLYDPKPGSKP